MKEILFFLFHLSRGMYPADKTNTGICQLMSTCDLTLCGFICQQNKRVREDVQQMQDDADNISQWFSTCRRTAMVTLPSGILFISFHASILDIGTTSIPFTLTNSSPALSDPLFSAAPPTAEKVSVNFTFMSILL